MRRVLFVIWRDVRGQIRTSRNIGDSRFTFVRRMLWTAFYMLKAFKCGLSAIRREQLGSAVLWQGRKCFICNWAGSDAPTLSASGFYKEYVPRNEIHNLFNLREIAHRFTFGFEFYSGNWMGIDVQNRVLRLKSKCSSPTPT